MAGRTGDIRVVHAFRHNIGAVAENSGVAKQRWTDDKSFDAWLIWNVWQVANPTLAEAIPVAERWRIYRDAGVALTVKGRERTAARDFAAFLQSPDGARIFAKWGWMTADGKGVRVDFLGVRACLVKDESRTTSRTNGRFSHGFA